MTCDRAPLGAVCALFVTLTACSSDSSDYAALKRTSADNLTTMLVEQNFDAWFAFYQPGALLNGTQLGARVMEGYARGLHHAFPDLTLSVKEQIAADGTVVTHFVIQGTHKGAFNTLPPSNRYVELEGVAIDHFQDDLIASTRLMLDVSRLNNTLLRGSQGARQ